MFSSTYTSNPFPSFPSSSSYPPLPFFIDPENAFASNTFLHDPLAVLPFIPTQAPIPETVTNLTVADCGPMLQKDAINVNGAHYGSSISSFITKKPAKRDRHSKIHTSHGLRDRRVRLSSEIARKFFDLQDMLEYDKPSNTLKWLFTKSENAIKELVRSKHRCSDSGGDGDGDAKCFCFSSELQLQGVVDSNGKSLVGDGGAGGAAAKGRKLKWVEKEDVSVQVQAKKESREKARARARQRTSSKICSTESGRVQDMEERFPAIANPQILHQLMPSIQSHDEACASWPKLVHYPHLDGFDVIEESIVLKRNLKPSLLSFHHQNLGIPKEASFYNSDYHAFPNLPTNWDANGAINGHSNLAEYPA